MEWCTILLYACAVLGAIGWALVFSFRRRAIRYRAAFDRAFDIARRVYNFTDDERNDLTRLIGEPIEGQPKKTQR
jgi:hypothetical protein